MASAMGLRSRRKTVLKARRRGWNMRINIAIEKKIE